MLNDREEEDDDLVNEDSQNEEVGDAIHFFQIQNVLDSRTCIYNIHNRFCNVAGVREIQCDQRPYF